MKNIPYHSIIKKFPAVKVLVVGDAMLDLYIRGDVERISAEAPVPIVLERSREYFLGGAGNVAANVASLGGRVTLVSLVGDDNEGKILWNLCEKRNIVPRLVRVEERPTPRKMRALSGHHHMLRIDRETTGNISRASERKLIQAIQSAPRHDIVVVSDYAKGSVTAALIKTLKRRFGEKSIIANIRPYVDLPNYRNVRAITLNAKEGSDITRIPTATNRGAARAAEALARDFQASVVLTRGEHGMTIHDREPKKTFHISSRALNVFDVTGAGDTVVATLALMQGSGAPLALSAEVANAAAGVVVGMRGTVAIDIRELKAKLVS